MLHLFYFFIDFFNFKSYIVGFCNLRVPLTNICVTENIPSHSNISIFQQGNDNCEPKDLCSEKNTETER